MQERDAYRISRRGAMMALVAVPLANVLKPAPVEADLFGDVGVLIAQLEQQLQLVSNAIATVQNLVATVQHLSNVVQNGKMLLKRISAGDVQGVLDSAQGFISLARGVTGSLRRLDMDAKWWDTNIRKLIVTEQLTPENTAEFKVALSDMDKRRLASTAQVNQSFSNLKTTYDAVQNSSDAARASLRTEGIVGQMQLATAQNAALATIGATQTDMLALLARRNEEEMLRLSAERERNRVLVEGAFKGLGEPESTAPATLPVDIDHPHWGNAR